MLAHEEVSNLMTMFFSAYKIDYVLAQNERPDISVTRGDPNSLKEAGILSRYFPEDNAYESLSQFLLEKTTPQIVSQGETKCILISIPKWIIGLFYNTTESAIDSYKKSKAIYTVLSQHVS